MPNGRRQFGFDDEGPRMGSQPSIRNTDIVPGRGRVNQQFAEDREARDKLIFNEAKIDNQIQKAQEGTLTNQEQQDLLRNAIIVSGSINDTTPPGAQRFLSQFSNLIFGDKVPPEKIRAGIAPDRSFIIAEDQGKGKAPRPITRMSEQLLNKFAGVHGRQGSPQQQGGAQGIPQTLGSQVAQQAQPVAQGLGAAAGAGNRAAGV